MLNDNSKLTDVNETIAIFWEMFIVYALLGNFDRHGGNGVFLKRNQKYTLAPIFDNGSCLFPNMVTETDMQMVINSKEETEKRIYTHPTSQVLLNGEKSSHYEVIASGRFKECNGALIKIYERINMKETEIFIHFIEMLSTIQKQFYIHMVKERYEKIIVIHTIY